MSGSVGSLPARRRKRKLYASKKRSQNSKVACAGRVVGQVASTDEEHSVSFEIRHVLPTIILMNNAVIFGIVGVGIGLIGGYFLLGSNTAVPAITNEEHSEMDTTSSALHDEQHIAADILITK